MDVDQAARVVGNAMRDYVMARLAVDRRATYEQFRGLKHAFRTTYGLPAWRDAFEWIVDDWDLEPYIFDREALRDS